MGGDLGTLNFSKVIIAPGRKAGKLLTNLWYFSLPSGIGLMTNASSLGSFEASFE